MRSRRLTVAVTPAVLVPISVLLVVVVVGLAVSRLPVDRPVVPAALAVLPVETQTASVTDWTQVRDRVGTDLDAAYEADLTAVSLLAASTDSMREHYGWSVHDVVWESFAQSKRGAGAVVQLRPDVDIQDVRAQLSDLGYEEPASEDGVWKGGSDLVASVDPGLTPMLSYVVVRDGAGQVVLSDRATYAERVAGVLDGSVASMSQGRAREVGLELRSAIAANVHVGARGCKAMGYARASAADRAHARDRVAAVGGVNPHRAVGLAMVPAARAENAENGTAAPDLRLAMGFDGAVGDEAETRAALARGDAVGQGGTFGQRFRLTRADTSGRTVVLDMEPASADSQLLSDLGRGSFLPAVC